MLSLVLGGNSGSDLVRKESKVEMEPSVSMRAKVIHWVEHHQCPGIADGAAGVDTLQWEVSPPPPFRYW